MALWMKLSVILYVNVNPVRRCCLDDNEIYMTAAIPTTCASFKAPWGSASSTLAPTRRT